MITLYAKRVGTSVIIYDSQQEQRAIFPNTGYRPTKATKLLTLNCWTYNLKWI